MSVSPFIQSGHTHAPDGEKKKNQRCCIPQVPFGRPLNRYPDPIPTKVATIL